MIFIIVYFASSAQIFEEMEKGGFIKKIKGREGGGKQKNILIWLYFTQPF